MNLNGIDAGFEAGQLTLSARLGGGGVGTAAVVAATRVTTYSYEYAHRGYTTGTAASL